MNRVLAKWNVKAGVEFTRIHHKSSEIEAENVDRFGNQVWPDNRRSVWIPSPHNEWDGEWVNNTRSSPHGTVIESISAIVDNDPKLKPLIWNVGTDPGCVEIPSAPLTNWKNLRSFYMQIDQICADHGFTANDNAIGTGSHIHVEHKNDKELQAKIFRDMYYRPYVMWAFANPQDDQNCNALATGKFPRWVTDSYDRRYYGEYNYSLEYSGYALRMQDETVEFRLFDMTWNWEEQEEHMAYVQAYIAWIKSDAYVIPKPLKVSRFNEIPLATAKRWFKKHIETLGLPWERYRKYVGYIEGRYQWKTLGNTRNGGKVHADARRTMAENIAKYDTAFIKKHLHRKKD